MSAFVIDGKKKRQYMTLFVVSIIVSFALGFTSGYFTNLSPESPSFDQLKSRIYNESEIPNEDQPQEGTVDADKPTEDGTAGDAKQPDEKESEGETPAKKTEAGAVNSRGDTKVSPGKSSAPVDNNKVAAEKAKPEPKPEPAPAPKPAVVSKAAPAVKPPPRPEPKPQPAPEPKPEPKPVPAKIIEQPQPTVSRMAPQPTAAPTVSPVTETAPVTPPAASSTEKLPVAYNPEPEAANDTTDSGQENQRAYAVQVGLFVNKDNAQKLVYELLDKGYDAYMDEFQASDGEIKYNVRFGRYPDRASVQSKLAEYKRAYASPAYIIITK